MNVEITPLTEADIKAEKANPSLGRPKGAVAKIRERHHLIAKLHGAGLKLAEIARCVGMTAAGVKAWLDNQANAELVAQYAGEYADRTDAMLETRLAMQNEIAVLATAAMRDQLITDIASGQPIPYDKLVKLGAHVDDRTGLGRQETKLNLNMDLGSRLDKAREAKKVADEARAEGKVVPFVRRV